MQLNRADYRNKVMGCWMGKNIGGTLGYPFEWRRQVNQVTFYAQGLRGEPMPNDDLDIQLLWLIALEEQGVDIDAQLLSEYWLTYLTPNWVEYGNSKINLRSGLLPPLCGSYENPYQDSCGAFIRSEIWACITPGCPRQAARYAYQDAIIDHGGGEGTCAEVFTATLESAAFVLNDLDTLFDIGLSYIPKDCGVAGAVHLVRDNYRKGCTFMENRTLLLEKFRGSAFRNNPAFVSAEDLARGFDQGQLGWDAPSNIGITVMGLLYGEGDFGNTVTTAVNCGEDTDCTAATAGSIFGIIHGLDDIPADWTAPIGRRIKTACLELGGLGYFGDILPADIDQLTARTEQVMERVADHFHLPIELAEGPTQPANAQANDLIAGELSHELYSQLGGPVFRFDFFDVYVDYGGSPEIRDHAPKTLRLVISNKYRLQARMYIRWLAPEDWTISPAREGQFFIYMWKVDADPRTLSFDITPARVQAGSIRLVVELTVDSRATAMLVPIVLLNGNIADSAGKERSDLQADV